MLHTHRSGLVKWQAERSRGAFPKFLPIAVCAVSSPVSRSYSPHSCFRQPPALHMARHILSVSTPGFRPVQHAADQTALLRFRLLAVRQQQRKTVYYARSLATRLTGNSRQDLVGHLDHLTASQVWGVADVFTGASRNSIATIGNVNLTRRVQRAFQNELNALSLECGAAHHSRTSSRVWAPTQQILNNLIGWAAVDTHTTDLKLTLSDAAIVEDCNAIPRVPRCRRKNAHAPASMQ